MATGTKEREAVSVAPFGIEITHPRNNDVLIQGLPGCRLRSAIRPVKDVFSRDPATGEQITKPVSAQLIDGLPANLPGMQLYANPKSRAVRVIDPLYKDEDMLEKIGTAMKHAGVGSSGKVRGVAPREESLGVDELKTLVREMVWLVQAGEASVAKGVCPDLEDVDELPGDYLLSPNKTSQWNQPRYEKDEEAWKQKLNRLGG